MAQQLQLQQQQKSKKKLGQNLNKLIPVALSKDNGKATASSNPHGLLLLSGSRKSSSFGTPDASLLSKGAAAKDAWGVVKQQQQQQQPQENVKPKNAPFEEKPKGANVSVSASASSIPTAPVKDASLSAASWDDYGGRSGTSSPVSKTTTKGSNAVLPETSAAAFSAASVAATHGGSSSNSSNMVQRAAEIKHNEEMRQKLQMERAAARLKELDAAKSAAVAPLAEQPRRTLYEPNTSTTTGTTSASDKTILLALDRPTPAIPTTTTAATAVIHLTSYEDRDRGEQRTSTPRMLYDPKSGSMVAVKGPATSAAIKTTTTSTREARKSRKSQQPIALLKRSVPSPTASHESSSSGKAPPSPMVATTAPARNANKRGGRKDVVASVAPTDGKPTDKLTMANTTSTAKVRNAAKRGGRNSSGNAISNNTSRTGSNTAANNNNNNRRSRGGRSRNGRKDEDEGDMYNNNGTYGVALYTGFDPEALEHTGMQQHYYTADEQEEEEEVMPVFEVLKADDKIELLTGEDDSPTLKPTAKVFAPSQAALAAAARSDAKADQYHSNNNTDDDEDEEDDDGPLGLGFDPPFDMDGLMQSPIVPAGSMHHGDFDLNALKLNPPLNNNNNDNGLPRHIFAFGSSGTWGDAQVHSSTDWDVPIVGLGGRGGLFGDVSDTFGLAKSKDSAAVSEAFLNLPTGSAWGGFGKGGISAAENQKTGD